MLIKNPKLLTGMLLLLSLSIVSASPAKAALTQEQLQHHQPDQNTDKDNRLLSQLRGHDLYEEGEQISPTEYKIGRVVGKTGNILFVVLDDGTYFRTDGYSSIGGGKAIMVPHPGCDVLVSESDGSYYVVEGTHPMWISRLDIKEEVSLSGPLSSRTAPLWQQLEASMSRTAVEMPPPQPAPAYSAPASTYQEAPPVRALW